jgi:hypothetical protein
VNIQPWLKRILAGVLTTAAVLLGALIQLVLVVLLCFLLPDEIAAVVVLISPFAIGVGNYFAFHRIKGNAQIHTEAERWLSERSRRSPLQRARLYRSKQIGIWIPTVFVMSVFLFLPELFGVATHVLQAGPAKLIGYEISFPVTWILTGEGTNDTHTGAFAGALDCRGPLRSGLHRYWPLSLQASAVDVNTSSSGSALFRRNPNAPVSVRPVRIGGEPAVCREYPRYYNWEPALRIVECSTLKEEISIFVRRRQVKSWSFLPQPRACSRGPVVLWTTQPDAAFLVPYLYP